jgi:hypothetical protein
MPVTVSRRAALAICTAVATVFVAVACNLTDGLTGGPELDSAVADVTTDGHADAGPEGSVAEGSVDAGSDGHAEAGPEASPSGCGACPSGPNSVPTCGDAGCGLVCIGPFADCDHDAGDGCEIDLSVDSANCGACGHGCQGGPCAGGACGPVTVFSGSNAPAHIAMDSTYIFGVNGEGTVLRLEKAGDGGDAITLTNTTTSGAQLAGVPPRIAIDGNNVYWTVFSVAESFVDAGSDAREGGGPDGEADAGGDGASVDGAPKDAAPADGGSKDSEVDSMTDSATDSAPPGAILMVPEDGGVASALLVGPAAPPYAIAATGGSVYWSEGNPGVGDLGTVHTCQVASCGTTQGTGTPSPSGRIYGLVVYDNQVLFSNALFSPTGAAAPGGSIQQWSPAALAFAPPLVNSLVFPYSVALDPPDAGPSRSVYFTLFAQLGSIESCPGATCSSTASVLDPSQNGPRFLASDGVNVYFTTLDGAVKSIPVAGTANTPERILFQLHGSTPWDIAVDATSVYWTSLATAADPAASLRRLAK